MTAFDNYFVEAAFDELIEKNPEYLNDEGMERVVNAGAALAKADCIRTLDNHDREFLVGSAVVNTKQVTCTCGAVERNGTCEHLYAVILRRKAKLIEAEFRREYEAYREEQQQIDLLEQSPDRQEAIGD